MERILSWRTLFYLVLSIGNFVLKDLVPSDCVLGNFVQRWFCPRGFCPEYCHVGYCHQLLLVDMNQEMSVQTYPTCG